MSAPAIDDLRPRIGAADAELSLAASLTALMRILASLKLTVTLFALGIFVVLVGTLAQQEANIGQVVHDYFHSWVMWVDVNLLFPKMFLPWMPHIQIPAPAFIKTATSGFITNFNTFPAPGGLIIGTLMAINLLAAHGWRFTVQTRGVRLLLGIIVMAIGLAIGVLIIWAGHNSHGFQTKPPFSWATFWNIFRWTSAALWAVGATGFAYFGIGGARKKSSISLIQLLLIIFTGSFLISVGLLVSWGLLSPARPNDEALRIVWQLVQGGLAAQILLVGCILVFRKRGGMVLLHLGVGLLIFNELWVAMTARERQVFMQEGQTVDYLRDIRTVELAVVDRSDKETDEHVVVPRSMLLANYDTNQARQSAEKPLEYIDLKLLPLKVAVVKYFDNAFTEDLKPGEKSLATAGRGADETLVERRTGKGTDTGGEVDIAGAYVKFVDRDDHDVGTYLVSQLVDFQRSPDRFGEKLVAGDKKYDLFLRFKREYKPYTLNLLDVRKDDYVASNTPRNYSSDVKIHDPEVGVEETVHIKMNDPLRYRGDTFYQSNYSPPDGAGSKEATTLQVVLNRGWMIPYVACMIVVIGMVAHFLISVTRFISRREAEELAAGDVIRADVSEAGLDRLTAASTRRLQASGKGKSKRKIAQQQGFNWSAIGLPTLAAGIFVLMVGSAIRPPKSKPNEMDFVRFGQLPVAHMGRIKPLDTLARNSVRALTINSESAKTADGKRIPAVQWLLEVMSGSDESLEMPIIRIDSKEVRRVFDLPDRPGFYYAVKELQPNIGEFEKQAKAAEAEAEDKRSVEQRRIIELDERLKLYITLVQALSPPHDLPQIPTEEEAKADSQALPRFIADYKSVMDRTTRAMTAMKAPRVIPIEREESMKDEDAWQAYPLAYAKAVLLQMIGQNKDEATIDFNAIISAYHKHDASAFNAAVVRYEAEIERLKPPLWNETRVHEEAYFNHVAPFYVAMILYVAAFLMAIFGWLFRYRPLNWAAFTLILLTFLFHTGALGLRIYISGRPPVTNLYSAAVFIGWAAVLFGLAVEAIWRLGLGNIVAATAGYATLLIAYLLSAGGDTIAVLQAVLDTQFWLATHVVCITLGYAATYMAGLFGVLYVVFGFFTPMLDKDFRKEVGRIIYGITCFAILFSFFGTVLGGLWADDSWGRFWGWDPKENGALIIVLWNALILHARWDKMVADRGLAVLAIGGNIVTSWSFFGVNQLGIGLHSYGFTNGVAIALDCFALSQLVLIAIGCLPKRTWWSFKAEQPPALQTAA
ncbi:MAG TPA: cytochrome c biogenesis protein CcsA [Pirellulaceae bacterium]|jgi:ABC-type transport system involved in cytochrome c biogenesis permease subunit